MTEREEAIIRSGLARGYFGEDDLDRCRTTLEELTLFGIEKPLVEVLLDHGLLTSAQRGELESGGPPPGEPEPAPDAAGDRSSSSRVHSAAQRLESSSSMSLPDPGEANPDLGSADFDEAEIEAVLEDDFPDGTMDFEPSELDFAVGEGEEEPSVPSSVSSSGPGGEEGPDATVVEADLPHELLGQVLGGCRLGTKLGQGAMGTVFKAEHLALRKTVAVKLLNPSRFYQRKQVEQFFQEARAAAAIEHHNIVAVHDVGEERGLYFIVMQYIEGESLDAVLKRQGRVPVEDAVRYVLEASRGLAVAHAKNIVHRDIKPGNLMLTRAGEVKIADFGLAFQAAADEGSMTGGVEVMGTPSYMSPEQIDGRKVDHRADLYSLGVTLYYLTTGKKPFEGATPMEVLLKHMNERLIPPTQLNPDIPKALGQVIERLMAKEPANRYPGADELARDLEEILQGGKPKVVVAMEDFMQRMEELAKAESAPVRDRHPMTAAIVSGIVAAFCAILFTVGLPDISASGPIASPPVNEYLRRAEEEFQDLARFVRENPRELRESKKLIDAFRTKYEQTGYNAKALRLESGAEREYEALSQREGAPQKEQYFRFRREKMYVEALGALHEIPDILLQGQLGTEVRDYRRNTESLLRETTGMAYVPAGAFLAGRRAKEETLPAFLIDVTEVSNEDYAGFVTATGHRPPPHWEDGKFPGDEGNHPVVGVTFDDATAYAAHADKRLPTSLEWEKAARGTDGRMFPWGPKFLANRANAQGMHGEGLWPVESFPQGRSPYHCLNMAGNAFEWTDSTDEETGYRIVRGGAHGTYVSNVSTHATIAIPSDHRDPALPVGFRCAKSVR